MFGPHKITNPVVCIVDFADCVLLLLLEASSPLAWRMHRFARMLVAVVAFAAAINEFVLLLPSDEQAIVRLVGQYRRSDRI